MIQKSSSSTPGCPFLAAQRAAAGSEKNGAENSVSGCPFLRGENFVETAEKLDLQARRQGRGLDFWRVKYKPVETESAVELAAKNRPFEARGSEGDWRPIRNFEELQALVSDLEQQARSAPALAESGQVTAAQVADSLSGVPANALSQTPAESPTLGLLDFARGMARHHDNPIGFFQEFHAKFGDSFKVSTPTHGEFAFELDRDVLKEALRNTDGGQDEWEKSPLQGHGASFLLGKKNMFLSSGADWKVVQTALRPHFNGRHIQGPAVSKQLEDIFDDHLGDLKARVASAPDGQLDIDPRFEMQLPILDAALQLFLDTKLSKPELAELRDAFNTQMESLPEETINPTSISLRHLPGRGKLREAYKTLNGVADKIVARARQNQNPDSIVTSLMQAKDPETGQPFDDLRLRHEVLSLMEAGHETTATLLGWSMMMLAREPRVYDKLRKEADGGFDGDGLMSSKELRGLDYARDVVDESLRLYPPFYLFMRRAKTDTVAGGKEFEKGTTLVSNLYSAHRQEEEWGVEQTGFPAHKFRPERFDNTRARPMAFGTGARSCIGQALGRLEASMMLAKFSEQFDLVEDHRPIELLSDLSIHPKDGRVTLRLRGRQPACDS